MTVIYRHLKPCGEVFYIGIGSIKRAYNKNNRSDFWKKIVKKYGYEVQILKTGLTKQEAEELEIILIDYYGRRITNTGTLVNLSIGGNSGSKGYPLPKKTDEQKRTLSEIKIQNAEKRIKYICTETLKTWGSTTLCANYLGITVNKLRHFLDDKSPTKNTTTIMLYEKYLKFGTILPHPESDTVCINTLTKEVFSDIRKAADSIGVNYSTLHGILRRGNTNTTYIVLKKDYDGCINYPKNKKVGKKPCIDTQTNKIYNSIVELSEYTGIKKGTLQSMLTGKTTNTTYYVFLSDYDGCIHLPKVEKWSLKNIKCTNTGRVFKQIKDLSEYLNLTVWQTKYRIEQGKIDYEYI